MRQRPPLPTDALNRWCDQHGIRPQGVRPVAPAATLIHLAKLDRYINPAAIAGVRLDATHAAVWLIGIAEPLHLDGVDAVTIADWVGEVMS